MVQARQQAFASRASDFCNLNINTVSFLRSTSSSPKNPTKNVCRNIARGGRQRLYEKSDHGKNIERQGALFA